MRIIYLKDNYFKIAYLLITKFYIILIYNSYEYYKIIIF